MNKILAGRKRTCFTVLLLIGLVLVAISIILSKRNVAFA